MTPFVFTPSGKSGILSYTDDSTDASAVEAGANALMVFNPDTANVVVVNVGFTDGDTDAVVPTTESNGLGTVVGPQQTVILHFPQANYNATMYVSVAGDSATGNVFITPGAV